MRGVLRYIGGYRDVTVAHLRIQFDFGVAVLSELMPRNDRDSAFLARPRLEI